MTAKLPAPRKCAEMTRRGKAVFLLKQAVCILSFGMIYPNLVND